MSFRITVLPGQHAFETDGTQSLVDAGLANGVILPYSCRDGGCSTCKGRVVSGAFEAGEAPQRILEAADLEAGYTLFCQARPQSDMVIEAPAARLAGAITARKLPARVMDLQPLAPDVMLVELQLPPTEPFRYLPGQYLDVILKDGRRRSYSMATPPREDNRVQWHVRHTPGGAFTDHVFGAGATQMKVREIMRIEGPHGTFGLAPDTGRPLIFLAGGTGYAPVQAILQDMVARGDRRPATLYWGGRRPADLYLADAARALAADWPAFSFVPVVSDGQPEDGWQGRTGLVHQAVMADHPDLSGHEVYACGAPAMIDAARRDFTGQCGLPADSFYADAFTTEADKVAAGA